MIEEYYFCLYPWISLHKDWNSNVDCEQTDPTNLQQFHHNTVAETDKVGMYGKCPKISLIRVFLICYSDKNSANSSPDVTNISVEDRKRQSI